MSFVLFLGKKANRIDKIQNSDYGEEKLLQDEIEKYPEVLSISSSESLVSLAKEYSVATGSIDLICVDREGKIYLIETKLQKNSDKRKAVAQ
jgi:RecB family endonuclease NucS